MIFREEDAGGGAGAATPGPPATGGTLAGFEPQSSDAGDAPAKTGEGYESERLPDFSTLGIKAPAKESEPTVGTPDTKPAEKPAGEAPEAKEEPLKEEAKDAKSPEKPAEVKTEEKKTLPDIPQDDKDIEALQPKPNAPVHVIKSFNDIKAIARRERDTARAYAAEAKAVREEVKAAKEEAKALKESTGKLPKEVEDELEGLRKFNLLFQAENDPKFKAEYDGKVEVSEKKIFTLLEQHGLDPQIAEEIKEHAKAAKGDLMAWPRWPELINAFQNPIDRQEVLDSIKGRNDALGAKAAKLLELGESREKFMEAYNDRQKGEQLEFAKGVEKKSIELSASADWILEEEFPADANAEQKKVIEARNAIKKVRAETYSNNIRDSYERKADRVAEIALRAVEADVLREQTTELEKQRDRATARARELEQQLARIKNAGRMAHVESAQPEKGDRQTTEEEGKIGGDGATALERYFAAKNR